MRRYTLYIIYSIAVFCMAACVSDRYPEISEDVFRNDSIFNNEGASSRIPIIPSFANPTYNIVKPTRGTGVFNSWEADTAHWLTASFCTYAFWENADYSQTTQPGCLLNGDTLRIVDAQGSVQFFQADTTVNRYYPDQQEAYKSYKYNFYTFFCDSLKPQNWKKTTNKITADLTIDGSSDIIHSFAYHGNTLINATLNALPFKDNIYEQLGEDVGQKYLYSYWSGSRRINPLFHLNHLLSRFDINIKAVESERTDYSFLNMLIDSIVIVAPQQVTITIADKSWKEVVNVVGADTLENNTYEAEVEANTLLTAKAGSKKPFRLGMRQRPIGNTTYNHSHHDYDQIRQQWEQEMGTQDTAFYSISDIEADTLCRPLLVPPMESYRLIMYGRAMNIDNDGNLTQDKNGDWFRRVVSETELVLRDDEGQQLNFRAGTKYTITIFVYNDGGRISAIVTGIDDEQWIDDFTFDNIHD